MPGKFRGFGSRLWPFGTRAIDVSLLYVREGNARPRVDSSEPERASIDTTARTVRCHDLRRAAEAPVLEREGFALLPHRTAVENFGDSFEIAHTYLPELQQLLRRLTGSPHVFMHPRTILRSMEHTSAYSPDAIADVPARLVHCDLTPLSAEGEAAAVMERLGVARPPMRRLAGYTLWRSISPPPQDWPLAICDIRTVRSEDLVTADTIAYPGGLCRESEFYLLRARDRHRWCHFSDLGRDELLVFRQFDSGVNGPSGCPHGAFPAPAGGPEAAPRLSIEARAFVCFD